MPGLSNLVVGGVGLAHVVRPARKAPALKTTVRRSASRRVIGADRTSDWDEDMGDVTGGWEAEAGTDVPLIIADEHRCWHGRLLSAGRGQIGEKKLGARQGFFPA